MSIRAATPYLIFNGRTREAISLYERALGARVESLQRFGDVDDSCPEAQREHVMHAVLRVGEAVLMMSDGPVDEAPVKGGMVSVALDFGDEQTLRRAFEGLTATGQPTVPLHDTPWGAVFGVVEDALGVSWMLNFTRK